MYPPLIHHLRNACLDSITAIHGGRLPGCTLSILVCDLKNPSQQDADERLLELWSLMLQAQQTSRASQCVNAASATDVPHGAPLGWQ